MIIEFETMNTIADNLLVYGEDMGRSVVPAHWPQL